MPLSIATLDINGDNKLDLTITEFEAESFSIFVNDGYGTFTAHSIHSIQTGVVFIIIGDVNADNKLYIVTASGALLSVEISLNNGNGIFANEIIYSIDSEPFTVIIGNLNDDNQHDILVGQTESIDIMFTYCD
ncbi:unnamed protein product [Rotaria sp. Silwood1]|nr:unnamed protein product [Rotaria sp. Silwood1]